MKELEEINSEKSEYICVLTFAYHIGNIDVDKTGTLITENVIIYGYRDVVKALSQKSF